MQYSCFKLNYCLSDVQHMVLLQFWSGIFGNSPDIVISCKCLGTWWKGQRQWTHNGKASAETQLRSNQSVRRQLHPPHSHSSTFLWLFLRCHFCGSSTDFWLARGSALFSSTSSSLLLVFFCRLRSELHLYHDVITQYNAIMSGNSALQFWTNRI